MRKTILCALVLVAGAALSSAQTTTTGSAPNIATIVQQRVARLTTLLTLTSAQQTQATTIFTTELTSAQTIMTSLQTAHTAITAAIKKNDTATIDSESTTVGTLTGQLTDLQSKANAAFYAILTADQQTKYDQLGPGGGFGGPGGGPHGNFRGARP